MIERLVLVDRPERDWNFQVGDFCVLNSGSPVLEVIAVEGDGSRRLAYSGGEFTTPSICLRPHFMDRMLIAASRK